MLIVMGTWLILFKTMNDSKGCGTKNRLGASWPARHKELAYYIVSHVPDISLTKPDYNYDSNPKGDYVYIFRAKNAKQQ